MKRYQAGGLAAVVPPPDPEEDEIGITALMDPSDLIQTMGPGAVTGTEEIIDEAKKPDMYKMAEVNRDTAIQQLRAAQDSFKERRTNQQRQQEQDKWLAFASAMLAPTQTGGFGESLGAAAGALGQASAQRFDQDSIMAAEEDRLMAREQGIASDYFDALTNLEGFKNTSRARVVGTTIATDPRDQARVDANEMREADAKRVLVSTIMLPNGGTISRIETSDGIPYEEGGTPFSVVDPRKVPSQAAAQTAATATAGAAVKDQVTVAKMGIDAIPRLTRLQRAYRDLQSLREDTSGLTEKMRAIAQFVGISEVIDDNTTLAKLHGMFGQQVLLDLRALTGTKTDFEYKQVENMNANLRQNVDENLTIIDEQLGVLRTMIDKGEFAAQGLGEGPGTEEKSFWLENYVRHRKQQAEAAAVYDEETRIAPEHQNERLIEMLEGVQGDPEEMKRLLDEFREYYEIDNDVAIEARALGAPI